VACSIAIIAKLPDLIYLWINIKFTGQQRLKEDLCLEGRNHAKTHRKIQGISANEDSADENL
jgi:hypothetical protein